MERIGFMGGSFNPIHNGHLIMATQFVEHLGLECCYFVPAKVSPFKTNTDAINTASHRLKMVELAIAGDNKFRVDDFEISNDTVSYTYLTVEHFLSVHPNAKLFMLIGTDQAEKFDSWRNYESIIEKVQIAIAGRLSSVESLVKIESIWKNCGSKPLFLPTPEIEISSEMLRSRLAKGLSIEYFVPKVVAEYASQCGIYRTDC